VQGIKVILIQVRVGGGWGGLDGGVGWRGT